MVGLSKQHFNKIAEIININITSVTLKENDKVFLIKKVGLISDLAEYFKEQNPLFDENRFKKACLK